MAAKTLWSVKVNGITFSQFIPDYDRAATMAKIYHDLTPGATISIVPTTYTPEEEK